MYYMVTSEGRGMLPWKEPCSDNLTPQLWVCVVGTVASFPPGGTGEKGFWLTEFRTQGWPLKNPHLKECFPCSWLLSYHADECCESHLTRVLILKHVS